jgi:hypothetical protein
LLEPLRDLVKALSLTDVWRDIRKNWPCWTYIMLHKIVCRLFKMGSAKHKYYFCRRRSPTVCRDRSKIHFMRSKPPITVNSVEWISGKLSVTQCALCKN